MGWNNIICEYEGCSGNWAFLVPTVDAELDICDGPEVHALLSLGPPGSISRPAFYFGAILIKLTTVGLYNVRAVIHAVPWSLGRALHTVCKDSLQR